MKKKLFEIQYVLHKADLIYFTWNDVGGTYKVYRDGRHLYEGTVSEFSDGDFNHAKLYNYVIERVEDGIVVDVIAHYRRLHLLNKKPKKVHFNHLS